MEWDLEVLARAIVEFFTDETLRAFMTERTAYWAEHKLKDEFTTSCNMQNWLWLCLEEARHPGFAGNNRLVRDLVKTYQLAA